MLSYTEDESICFVSEKFENASDAVPQHKLNENLPPKKTTEEV
jgi:hypothetical protein